MIRLVSSILLLSIAISGQAAMTLNIVSAPQLTPLWDTLYVAGNFNNWNEHDANYMCTPTGNGWTVQISGPENMSLEFKFTRGTWSRVEGDANGGYIGNRTATLVNTSNLEVQIAGWEDLAGNHTITSEVRVLDSNYLIPQLNRQRRIWIRLPEGYSENNEGYPVIYAMDGQNCLDQASSFAGEWELDESLDEFSSEVCSNAIVIAIDNGGSLRIDEYSPWLNTTYDEGGEGDAFASFLAENLKPAIDAEFNTLSDPANTMIIGSSLGALIATYTICKYPAVFGKAGLFSPAYWFNPEIFTYADSHPLLPQSKLYFVAGTTESDDMVPDMQAMQTTVLGASVNPPQTFLITHADGAHSEWYWRREFPDAYSWLSGCEDVYTSNILSENEFVVFPNPFVDSLELSTIRKEILHIIISDITGKVCLETTMQGQSRLNLPLLSAGTYVLRISLADGTILFQESIIKK
jgi:predicted alpha/beta superfamily hydrolase